MVELVLIIMDDSLLSLRESGADSLLSLRESGQYSLLSLRESSNKRNGYQRYFRGAKGDYLCQAFRVLKEDVKR